MPIAYPRNLFSELFINTSWTCFKNFTLFEPTLDIAPTLDVLVLFWYYNVHGRIGVVLHFSKDIEVILYYQQS